MIDWLTWTLIGISLIAGLLCLGFAAARKAPNDLVVAALALVELSLLVQLVVAIIAPMTGNHASGNLLEFWVYLITVLLIPPAAVFWALIERSRWASLVLGGAALSVAIMVWRMHTIWFFQVG